MTLNELQIRAILSGMAWGIWPLVMSRSGLSGNVSAATFDVAVFLCVLPFALRSIGISPIATCGTMAVVGIIGVAVFLSIGGMLTKALPTANWTLALIAGLFGAVGLLIFNGMLSKALAQGVSVSPLFITMIVAQMATPAVYQVVKDGHLTPSKGAGFVAAFTAAWLLGR